MQDSPESNAFRRKDEEKAERRAAETFLGGNLFTEEAASGGRGGVAQYGSGNHNAGTISRSTLQLGITSAMDGVFSDAHRREISGSTGSPFTFLCLFKFLRYIFPLLFDLSNTSLLPVLACANF